MNIYRPVTALLTAVLLFATACSSQDPATSIEAPGNAASANESESDAEREQRVQQEHEQAMSGF